MPFVVHEIRRYPVKSMAGESLTTVEIDARGLVGDRWYAVVDGDGRLSSGKNSKRFRRRDAVFDFASRTTDEGVLVAGPCGEWSAGDPALDQALADAMGDPVRVLAEGVTPHYDDGPCRWSAPRRSTGAASTSMSTPTVDVSGPTWWSTPASRSWRRPGRARSRSAVPGSMVDRRIQRCRMIEIAQQGLAARRLAQGAHRGRDISWLYVDVARPAPCGWVTRCC